MEAGKMSIYIPTGRYIYLISHFTAHRLDSQLAWSIIFQVFILSPLCTQGELRHSSDSWLLATKSYAGYNGSGVCRMADKSHKPMGRPKGKPRTAAEIAADAKRTGRPGLTPEANATKLVALRLTPAEFERFKKDAKKHGMGMAAFARHCWYTMRKG